MLSYLVFVTNGKREIKILITFLTDPEMTSNIVL